MTDELKKSISKMKQTGEIQNEKDYTEMDQQDCDGKEK